MDLAAGVRGRRVFITARRAAGRAFRARPWAAAPRSRSARAARAARRPGARARRRRRGRRWRSISTSPTRAPSRVRSRRRGSDRVARRPRQQRRRRRPRRLARHRAEAFDRVDATNLRGVWLMSVAAAERWRQAKRGGAMVNIASILGFRFRAAGPPTRGRRPASCRSRRIALDRRPTASASTRSRRATSRPTQPRLLSRPTWPGDAQAHPQRASGSRSTSTAPSCSSVPMPRVE